MTGQVQLFPAPRALEERLGRDLFDGMPKQPGIYRFYDGAGSLLYVGKAANLRSRLASYRRARPGWVSRKVSGLVSRIHRIETEVMPTARDALIAENRWIRTGRPPFNHANKHTETYYYIIVGRESTAITIRLTMRKPEGEENQFLFGCFKGHTRVRRMLGSLLQLLWLAVNRPQSPHYLPVQLTRRITPMYYRLAFDNITSDHLSYDRIKFIDDTEVARSGIGHISDAYTDAGMVLTGLWDEPDPGESFALIQAWFDGRSDYLLHRLAWWNRQFCMASPFNRNYLEAALACLDDYYTSILMPHRRMREVGLGGRPTIGRDELDDLLVAFPATDRSTERIPR
jgi:hypothetical protein